MDLFGKPLAKHLSVRIPCLLRGMTEWLRILTSSERVSRLRRGRKEKQKMKNTIIPRSEFPRPDLQRDCWMSLNGEWDFSFEKPIFDRKIIVPYACETELSGINDKGFHKTVWYKKKFTIPAEMKEKQIWLCFGAVDYEATVWVNNAFVVKHEGGQTSFRVDISACVEPCAENEVVVMAFDDYSDMEMPRGKQYWKLNSESIFYSRTTGIWQSVWLEGVNERHLQSLLITPDYDDKSVEFEYALSEEGRAQLGVEVSFEGQAISSLNFVTEKKSGSFVIKLDEAAAQKWNYYEDLSWTPEAPHLFDVVVNVYDDGSPADTVRSYFGMRKVSVENGQFMLNNRPYYQKLVLDQGYWPEGLLTAPTDESYIKDIQLIKAMGFNGVRKHQKVEDPRFLYHADRMGLLVWGEIGASYIYSGKAAKRLYQEWQDTVLRDYNHPCIVVWTPVNESWGVQEIYKNKKQQAHVNALGHMIRSLDATRLVIDNDGWEHTAGDLLTIHDYTPEGEKLYDHFRTEAAVLSCTPAGRPLFCSGYCYHAQPVIISEFGGIRYSPSENAALSWGYTNADTEAEYLKKLAGLVSALKKCQPVQGYCYTQLTDIENEENGLLHYDRSEKVAVEKIRAINEL